ncbi:DUF4240 domain-containing protein [Rossellomorea marisflavi]|uniref:DUF4240 domain-containing protein n=1 Tax=Rossellomorea marisflavi TaxID=189381 RepID=UPI004044EFD2
MSKKKNKPMPGQIYAAEFPNKYWCALGVLSVVGNSYLVYTTAYYDLVPPEIEDARLSHFYYSYDLYTNGLIPTIYWIDGKPGEGYKLIGEVNLKEKSDIKESNMYRGIWKSFLPIHLMKDKEKLAENVYKEEPTVLEADYFEELGEKTFWSLIDLIDTNQENPMEVLICHLEKMSIERIYAFEETLSHKLFLLDRPEHAGVDGESEEYLSPDAFLYARCAVITEGQHYFDQVVKEAAEIDLEWDAEELLEVASEAYSRKTEETFEYVSRFDYETYSNTSAWEKRNNQK